jgi:hypothetical protein
MLAVEPEETLTAELAPEELDLLEEELTRLPQEATKTRPRIPNRLRTRIILTPL